MEIKDKNYSVLDKDKSFTEFCELVVKTTDENGNTTEEEKEGVQIKGKDVIYLNSPLILPSKDTPLLTEAPDIVGAINELFQDGSGGGDDWQPPDWWIPVPEPEPYEILVLVWVTSTNNSFGLALVNNETGQSAGGALNCDWGDGTQTNIPAGVWWGGSISHKFEELGQFLIKITTTDELNVMYTVSKQNCSCQIIKTGSNILFFDDYHDEHGYTNSPFANHAALKYIKINNAKGLPIDKSKYYFQYDYGLQKIELQKPMSGNINRSCFEYNQFKDFQLLPYDNNSVTTVGEYAFQNNFSLQKIILPNCISVGDYAFASCYNLQEIVVAEGCTFGNGCFTSCYSLYPKPNGQTN